METGLLLAAKKMIVLKYLTVRFTREKYKAKVGQEVEEILFKSFSFLLRVALSHWGFILYLQTCYGSLHLYRYLFIMLLY